MVHPPFERGFSPSTSRAGGRATVWNNNGGHTIGTDFVQQKEDKMRHTFRFVGILFIALASALLAGRAAGYDRATEQDRPDAANTNERLVVFEIFTRAT